MNKTSTRLMALTSSVALAAGLAACAPYDPYGPNNYPVSQTPPASLPGHLSLLSRSAWWSMAA